MTLSFSASLPVSLPVSPPFCPLLVLRGIVATIFIVSQRISFVLIIISLMCYLVLTLNFGFKNLLSLCSSFLCAGRSLLARAAGVRGAECARRARRRRCRAHDV
jgi:hypothetical protein